MKGCLAGLSLAESSLIGTVSMAVDERAVLKLAAQPPLFYGIQQPGIYWKFHTIGKLKFLPA